MENDDLSSIDLSAYMAEPGLVVIEWPEIVQEQLPEEYLQIVIKRIDDSWNSTKRVVEFVPKGRRNEQWAEKIIEKVS